MRSRTFKLSGVFDQASGATVRITPSGDGEYIICVRPKGRRREYTLPLAIIANSIIMKVVKAEAGIA